MPKSKKDLAIVIISYNTKDLLENCLTSVYEAQQPKKGIEVIVVDNNSKDDSVDMVKKEFPQVNLIENKENSGFSKANNIGIKKSNSTHYLFLNSDTVVGSYSLVKPLKYLKNHPKVGALTVKLILGDGTIDYDNRRGFPTPWSSFCRLFGLSSLFPKSTFFNSYYLGFRPIIKPESIPVTAGSFVMMPKKAYDEIGGWDEDYFFYGEDIDLCFTLRKKGYDIVYYPKTTTVHLKGASSGVKKETKKITTATKETRLRVARSSIEAWEIFIKKHYVQKYPKIVIQFILLGVTLKGRLRILKHKLLK